jgi:hypothetical protein
MPPTETEKKDNSEKIAPKKKWKIMGGIFLLLLIGAIILIWLKMQQPIAGEVITTNSTPAEEREKAVPAFERFEGQYLSFRHRADYAVKAHNEAMPANGVIWETAFLATGEINSTRIALTVESLEKRKLEDTTGYNLRKMNPRKYREEKFFAGEFGGTAFTALESETYEKVVFLEHNNYLVAIALTGPNGSDAEKDQELKDIIQSIQWKK